MDNFTLLLAVLGVYRLSHMIAMEDGPFDVFAEMREHVGQATWFGRGLHCPLCLSFWLSLAMMGWLVVAGLLEPRYSVVAWLGIAGGCLVAHLLLYREATE